MIREEPRKAMVQPARNPMAILHVEDSRQYEGFCFGMSLILCYPFRTLAKTEHAASCCQKSTQTIMRLQRTAVPPKHYQCNTTSAHGHQRGRRLAQVTTKRPTLTDGPKGRTTRRPPRSMQRICLCTVGDNASQQ